MTEKGRDLLIATIITAIERRKFVGLTISDSDLKSAYDKGLVLRRDERRCVIHVSVTDRTKAFQSVHGIIMKEVPFEE